MTVADEAMKRIRTETARRKKLWAEVVAATREAYEAVEGDARRRNIPPRVWLGYQNPPRTLITCAGGYGVRLTILPNGRLSIYNAVPHPTDAAYQNYPNITDKVVENYRISAVEHLMGELNVYVSLQREERARKKRKH